MPLDSLTQHDGQAATALVPILHAAGLNLVATAQAVTSPHAYPGAPAADLALALFNAFASTRGGVRAALIATGRYNAATVEAAVGPLGPAPEDAVLFLGFYEQQPIKRLLASSGAEQLFAAPSVATAWAMADDAPRNRLYYVANGGTIRRMAYDGTGDAQVVAGQGVILGLAVDSEAGLLFWSEQRADMRGPILKADLDGQNAATVVDGRYISTGLGADPTGRRLYWREGDGAQNWSLASTAYDGSDVQTLAALGSSAVAYSLTVDPTRAYLYFLGWTGLARIPLAGGVVEVVHSPGSTVGSGGMTFLPGGERAAWVNWTDGCLYTVNLDGSDPVTVKTGLPKPVSLAAVAVSRAPVPPPPPQPIPPAPSGDAGLAFDGRTALVLSKTSYDQVAYRDSTGGYPASPNSLSQIDVSGFTLEMILRPLDLSGTLPLGAYRCSQAEVERRPDYILPGTPDTVFDLVLVDGRLTYRKIKPTWVSGSPTNPQLFVVEANRTLTPGQWVRVGLTVPYGGYVTLWVDGEAVGEAQGAPSPYGEQGWSFGGDTQAGFKGEMLSVALWSRAFSAAEMTASPLRLMTQDEVAAGQPHGLGGYWPMATGAGPDVADLTAVANTGRLTPIESPPAPPILPPEPCPPMPAPPPAVLAPSRMVTLGGDGYVRVSSRGAWNVGGGDFSIAARFQTQNPGTLLARKSTGGGSPACAGWLLVLQPGGGVKFATDNGYGFNELRTGGSQALDGNVHSIVAVRESGRLSVYLDGVPLDGSQGGSLGSPLDVSSELDLRIGSAEQEQEPFRGFAGSIGPAAIWNRALAPAEVVGWESSDPGQGGSVGFWRLDNDLHDASPVEAEGEGVGPIAWQPG